MSVNKILLTLFIFLSYYLAPTATAIPFSLNKMEAGILDLNSDSFKFNNAEGTITYTGNVVAVFGDRKLNANELVLYRNKEGELIKIIATGKPAHIQGILEGKPEIVDAYANKMEYDIQKQIIYLRGDARVERGDDIYQAPEIHYDVTNEIISSKNEGKERVHITISPETLKKQDL